MTVPDGVLLTTTEVFAGAGLEVLHAIKKLIAQKQIKCNLFTELNLLNNKNDVSKNGFNPLHYIHAAHYLSWFFYQCFLFADR